MGLHRYMKSPNGLRQYVIFLEEMTQAKRNKFIEHGLKENKEFVETALKHMLTFNKLCEIPEMELTETIAMVKPKMIAFAIKSLDPPQRERVLSLVPRNMIIEVSSYEDSSPSIAEQNTARLACIRAARELEARGILKSIIVPKLQNL